jgi:hypothetical protein
MKKQPFYFDNTTEFGSVLYRPWNLRHRLIEWMLTRNPVDEDMPEGVWIVTLSWEHSRFIPGLFFREA